MCAGNTAIEVHGVLGWARAYGAAGCRLAANRRPRSRTFHHKEKAKAIPSGTPYTCLAPEAVAVTPRPLPSRTPGPLASRALSTQHFNGSESGVSGISPAFFCEGQSLRTALRDHQPLTATNSQPPTATNRQPPPTANRQPPTANRQPPTANHRSILFCGFVSCPCLDHEAERPREPSCLLALWRLLFLFCPSGHPWSECHPLHTSTCSPLLVTQ